ncbi:hypothetical protein HN018_13140 [Lichenicola cladoniae]|uniref:Uncharacterized protein n=1 Tax=Lichenicola cladoniae TaxID=1484109 RepID=A0A6M8HRD6_9PROT|nr:hypothetical protein [Lichenicola cladoniae]NPD68709.1 hypothetical protein [Acetobacteraceae bacterium]QKE90856.1 hypothetical protein HN018_13140 [Lichenicola cladoniae]
MPIAARAVGCDYLAMNRDYLLEFEAILVGQECAISRREHDWLFALSGDGDLAVSVPWRVVSQGCIEFGSEDHGHLFGLSVPVDGEEMCRKLIGNRLVTSARVDRQTADLTLHFGSTIRIDIFNNSSGYEGWDAGVDAGSESMRVIALGGGNVAVFCKP